MAGETKEDGGGLDRWLATRPRWLQLAADRLAGGQGVAAVAVAGVEDCLAEVRTELPAPAVSASRSEGAVESVRLSGFTAIEGLNALAPRIPLSFAEDGMTVVYGRNGSGKTGYVRALAHASGATDGAALLGNVFGGTGESPTLALAVKIGVARTDKTLTWVRGAAPCAELRNVAIFDAARAGFYLDEERELAYEPPVLRRLTAMVEVCQAVDAELHRRQLALVSTLPAVPSDLAATEPIAWFKQVNQGTTAVEVAEHCSWDEAAVLELEDVEAALKESDPAQAAQLKRNTKQAVDALLTQITTMLSALSSESRSAFDLARNEALAKRAAARAAAASLADMPVDGVGSETWRQLWAHAREYSQVAAYSDHEFPHVADGARCVLCQQGLDHDARERLSTLDQYVRSATEQEAAAAEAHVETLKKLLPTPEAEARALLLSQLPDDLSARVIGAFVLVDKARAEFTSDDVEYRLSPEIEEARVALEDRAQQLHREISDLDRAAKGEDRNRLDAERKALLSNRWLHENRAAVNAEIVRAQQFAAITQGRRLTNTAAISNKKSALTTTLLTAGYAKRFQDELVALNASHARVEVIKTTAERGKVKHRLVLKGIEAHAAEAGVSEVLCDGELRAVALAAFLADHAGDPADRPFVFDDPITSLDEEYEQAAVSRLATLALERQVVVFTHRVATTVMLDEAAQDVGADRKTCAVEREPWGAGEMRDTPLTARTTGDALQHLRTEVVNARGELQQHGRQAYERMAQGICSDLRKILESAVENELIGGVVRRFRRKLTVDGAIQGLVAITKEDCAFIDRMMAKYSQWEHPQPHDAPVPLPEPDALDRDIAEIDTWRREFVKRRNAARKEPKFVQNAGVVPAEARAEAQQHLDAGMPISPTSAPRATS